MIEHFSPYTIEEFTDMCEEQGLVPVKGSGRWVEVESGKWVVAVKVRPAGWNLPAITVDDAARMTIKEWWDGTK